MSCECCEPERYVVHKRKLNIKGYRREMLDKMMNPGWDYEKHPVVAREIEMGMEWIKTRNPDFKNINIIHTLYHHGDEQELIFEV